MKEFVLQHPEILDANVYVANSLIYLWKKELFEEVKLVRGPRVGLTLKRYTPNKMRFLYSDYWFIDAQYVSKITKAKSLLKEEHSQLEGTEEELKVLSASKKKGDISKAR